MHWFSVKRTFKLGVKSLWMHRLRSVLTTLSIVFGVCSVIAMLAIGEGASRATQEVIARLGSTNLIIETVEPPKERADSGATGTIYLPLSTAKCRFGEFKMAFSGGVRWLSGMAIVVRWAFVTGMLNCIAGGKN